MREASRERNATHVFLPEHHQYMTQVSLKRRAQGVGDSLEVHAGCTLAMVSSQFLVWFLGPNQRCSLVNRTNHLLTGALVSV